MSTYYSSHIGCFLKIPNVEVPAVQSYHVMPDGTRAKSRFNPDTGVEYPTVTEVVSVKREVNPYFNHIGVEPFLKVVNSTTNDKYTIFIPNETSELCNMDTQWDFSCSLLNVDTQNEIAKFKDEHQHALAYYTECFGDYEIDFGVVRYGM